MFAVAWFLELMAIPFWAILITIAISGYWVTTVNTGRTVQAFIGFVLTVTVGLAIFQINPLEYMLSDWQHFFGSIAAYMVLGLVWGGLKWRLLLTKISNALNGQPEKWAATGQGTWSWNEFAANVLHRADILTTRQDFPLDVNQHLGSIACWMLYWPASLVWSLLGDVLYTLYYRFVIMVSQMFQGAADRHAGNFEKKAQAAKAARTADTSARAGAI